MKLKLIVIGALMLSLLGLAGCFEEDYGPYGYNPGYYGCGYSPSYYGGWWRGGDWDDYPHYRHWDGDDGGYRHGGWEHEGWSAPRGEFHERGPAIAHNEYRGGFHAGAGVRGGGIHAGAGAAIHGGGGHYGGRDRR